MKNHLVKQTDQFAANLAMAKAFAEKYGEKLPEGVASISAFTSPELYVATGYSSDDRNRVLALIGDVFGRKEWTRQIDYGRESFSWVKTVDGIRIVLNRVEPVVIPTDKSPVPPTSFPLQLAESTQESQPE